MAEFELKVNGRLEIKMDDVLFNSTIQDVKEDSFLISMPMKKESYVKFKNNEKLSIYYYFENTSLYKFESKVLGREKCGNMPLYKLTLPKEVVKIQRREYVRINIMAPVEIIKDNKKIHGLLLDLSGGGMRIKTEEKLSKEEILEIKLKSSEFSNEININGVVVRENRDEEGKYVYGIRYYRIEEKVREKIIQTIFCIMRAQIRAN